MAAIGVVTDKAWLQVTLDGTGVYTEELERPNAPRP